MAKLTIGVGGGVLLGTAALFWANRVAPAPVRMVAETWAFFGVWGLVMVAFLLRAESRTGWVGLLRISGGAFAFLPIASAVGTDAHLFNVVHHGRLDVLGVEIGVLLVGAALLSVASLVAKRVRPQDRRVKEIALGMQEISRQEA